MSASRSPSTAANVVNLRRRTIVAGGVGRLVVGRIARCNSGSGVGAGGNYYVIEYARSAQRCGNGYVIMCDINRLYFPCLRQGLISPVESVAWKRPTAVDDRETLCVASEWMGLRELSIW